MKHHLLFLVSALSVSVAFASPKPDSTRSAASRLIGSVGAKLKALSSYEFDAVTVRTFAATSHRPQMTITETSKVKVMRPNLFDVTSQDSNEKSSVRYISDGKNLYSVYRGKYFKGSIDPTAEDFHWDHNDLFLYFLTGSFEKAVEAPFPPSYSMLPNAVVDGEDCKVVAAEVGGGFPISYQIFIGPDGFPKRILHVEGKESTFTEDCTIAHRQTDAETLASFQFVPTSDLTAGADARPGHPTAVSIGDAAPEFTLPTPDGKRVSLTEAMNGKRALLLNFWFVHCPPCRAEHPKLQKFCDAFKDQGLGVLAIDDQDAPALVAKYMKGAHLHFQTVLSGPMAATDPKTGFVNYRGPKLPDYKQLVPYGVQWCPMNILLDSHGHVAYISDRWDEDGLRKALNNLGIE